MNDTRPILAATDFSEQAAHAARRAARVAEGLGAPLELLHVVPPEPLEQLRRWFGSGSACESSLLADAERELDAWLGDLGAALRRVEAGPPIDGILAVADTCDAQLIALGARGRGGWTRLVLGSTAERLMRRTARPLLVTRQPTAAPYRRMLVALDFSPWSQAALALALRLWPKAEPVLASVFQVAYEEKLQRAGVEQAVIEAYRRQTRAETTRRLHEAAAAAGLSPSGYTPCIAEGDAALRLVELEREHGCDLVVLGKHGVSATQDLLLGSVTRHVLAEGRADVLVSTAHPAA